MGYQRLLSALMAASALISVATPAYSAEQISREGLSVIQNGQSTPAVFTQEQLNANGMLCIRHNNYWCLKALGWNGEIGKDARGHAIFSSPVYAARAIAIQLRTWWYRDEYRTVFKIMTSYAPPDDCVGSVGTPPNCKYGINPTEEYATWVAKAVNLGPHDPIDLFDTKGKLNRKVAIPLMQAIAQFELTKKYHVSQDIISAGIDKAGL